MKITWELWPKQLAALTSQATELLWGGAAGGGKSHLERIAALVWCSEIPGLQYYLFRREYSDLIKSYVEGPTGFLALIAQLGKRVQLVGKELRFENGSKIYLCHAQHEKDVFAYNSVEFHVLNIAEAGEFTPFMIRYLRSRMRAPLDFLRKLPDKYTVGKGTQNERFLFPRAIYTTNPVGPGKEYLKNAFVDGKIEGEIYKAPPEDGGLYRQFIPAKLSDNPSLSFAEYSQKLEGIGSEAYVKALLDGNWSATLGAFFTEWDYERHVIPTFKPPAHWFRWRSFDWGSSAPFSVLWWCISDGSQISEIGRAIPRGAMVVYREWYGCQETPTVDITKGVAMRNEDIARGITERSDAKVVTLTDSLPFQDRGGVNIEETFLKAGVPLTLGDTSRIPGWSSVRDGLKGGDNGPDLYIMDCCPYLIQIIPIAQHDPTNPEELVCVADHCLDALRLGRMARARIKDPAIQLPNTANIDNKMTFNFALKQIQKHKNKAKSNGW